MPSIRTAEKELPNKPAHRRTPTANDFPTVPIPSRRSSVAKRDRGLVSPSQSSLAYSEDDHQPHALSTPATVPSTPITREFERGTPGEHVTDVCAYQKENGIQRTHYYNEAFTTREPIYNARERIHKNSVIVAEVKTNVIIRDEFQFLSDLSLHLSQRHQRPTTSIFITLDHSACLLFAGSFESAYILTITALPSQITPTTNKRNAALTQSFMATSLGVLPDRGIIRFVGIPDEYLATAGTTIFGQLERTQKATVNGEERQTLAMATEDPLAGNITQQKASTTSRRATQRKPPALSLLPKSQSTPGSRMPSPKEINGSILANGHMMPLPALPMEQSPLDRKAEKMQKVGKRKSIFAIFGR